MLRDDFMDYFAADVGEAEVAAGVAVGEFLVVEAEEVENGRVQVVDMDGILGGFETELVGGAVDGAAFDAAAGEPNGKAVGIVIAAFGLIAAAAEFDGGGAAEFAGEKDE